MDYKLLNDHGERRIECSVISVFCSFVGMIFFPIVLLLSFTHQIGFPFAIAMGAISGLILSVTFCSAVATLFTILKTKRVVEVDPPPPY